MIKHILLILIWGINVLMLQHFLDLSGSHSLILVIFGSILLIVFRKSVWSSIVPLLTLVGMFIWLLTLQASNERDWIAEVSRLPGITIKDDVVQVKNFRNFTWSGQGNSDWNWETRSYNLTKLNSLSLIVVPFHDSKYMAHTMLDFEFEDQGHVIVSVETRKEKGETYSLVGGALRQLELIYVFGSERDLLTLRAVKRKSKIHLYPIKAEPEFMASLFADLANSANKLHEQPEFYRTVRDNCTTTLVKHIDRHYQEKIGMRMEILFPAKAGKLLHDFGRMDTSLSYQKAYEASQIDHLVVKYQAETKRFSSLLHTDIELAYSTR